MAISIWLPSKTANGSWAGYCGASCDTAFSILFLLRSTQKSIHAKLGEGSLLAGRGLPTNLSRAKLHNGQLIVEQVHTKVDELLSMIDDGDDAKLDDLARDPSQLVVDQRRREERSPACNSSFAAASPKCACSPSARSAAPAISITFRRCFTR